MGNCGIDAGDGIDGGTRGKLGASGIGAGGLGTLDSFGLLD